MIEKLENTIDYKILNPGGNITALIIDNNYNLEERKELNNYILKKFKEVEQVGFISKKERKLEMAGGEFCVNATRCAIWEYLQGKPDKIELRVSGYNSIIKGGIDQNKNVYVNLPINKSFDEIIEKDDGFEFIKLDGIIFAVIDGEKSQKLIEKLKTNQSDTIIELKKIMEAFKIQEKAIGIILIEKTDKKIKINPIVWVKEINSLYYETACGSGSLATAIYMNKKKKIEKLEVFQPSGYSIRVQLDTNENFIKNAIVSGKIIKEE